MIKKDFRRKRSATDERWPLQTHHIAFLSSILVFSPTLLVFMACAPVSKDSGSTTITTTHPTQQVKDRIIAAIRGAFIADTASMGTHWIYDPEEMKNTVESVNTPEFRNPPTPRYYNSDQFPGHYGPGMSSPYGEQLLFVTEYIAKTGAVNGSEMSRAMLAWATSFGGRHDHALATFINNMKKKDGSGQWPNCGADDDQAHIFIKVVPVTCLYVGKPELQDKVIEAIKVHQNNKIAIVFGLSAACILEKVLLGSTLLDALDSCLASISSQVRDKGNTVLVKAYNRGRAESVNKDVSLNDLFQILSQESFYYKAPRTCKLPQAFTGPIFLLYKAAAKEGIDVGKGNAYMTAIRENILAAGDTCGRSPLVAAVLAALDPFTSLPGSWIERTDPTLVAKIDAAAYAIAEFAKGPTS